METEAEWALYTVQYNNTNFVENMSLKLDPYAEEFQNPYW